MTPLKTIKHPKSFEESLPPWSDGVFDWSWAIEAFSDTRITPMDFDGVIERRGNFLLFESKHPGVEIGMGQMITLRAAHDLGVFTVFIVHGKLDPEKLEIWYAGSNQTQIINPADYRVATKHVREWREFAERNPRSGSVDTAFLRRRIVKLEEELDRATVEIESLRAENYRIRVATEEYIRQIGGHVTWESEELQRG